MTLSSASYFVKQFLSFALHKYYVCNQNALNNKTPESLAKSSNSGISLSGEGGFENPAPFTNPHRINV